ncbi:MAG: UPF0145 protein YbjQ, partial [uncultured Thermomicrobiales bacterium]
AGHDDIESGGTADRSLHGLRERRGHPRHQHRPGPVRRTARHRRGSLELVRAGARPGQGDRDQRDGPAGPVVRRQCGDRRRSRLRDDGQQRQHADGRGVRHGDRLRGPV